MYSQVEKVYDYFLDHPKIIITYQELYETLWGVPIYIGFKNTLRATISAVRTMLMPQDSIVNVCLLGYMYIPRNKED